MDVAYGMWVCKTQIACGAPICILLWIKKAVSSTSLSPSNTSPLSLHKTREEAVTSDQCQPYGLMRNLLPRMTPSSSGTANEK